MSHFKLYSGTTLVSLCLSSIAFSKSNFTKISSNVSDIYSDADNSILVISTLCPSNLLFLLNNGLEYFAGIVNTNENKLASFADFIKWQKFRFLSKKYYTKSQNIFDQIRFALLNLLTTIDFGNKRLGSLNPPQGE